VKTLLRQPLKTFCPHYSTALAFTGLLTFWRRHRQEVKN